MTSGDVFKLRAWYCQKGLIFSLSPSPVILSALGYVIPLLTLSHLWNSSDCMLFNLLKQQKITLAYLPKVYIFARLVSFVAWPWDQVNSRGNKGKMWDKRKSSWKGGTGLNALPPRTVNLAQPLVTLWTPL